MNTFRKIATSKPVGKILDNKFVQKVMIPVGNKFIPKGKKSTITVNMPTNRTNNLTPKYKIPDAKYGNGSGWGGEKPSYEKNPSIKTTSKTNKAGEIINPTKKDIQNYNKKYETIRLPANVKFKK